MITVELKPSEVSLALYLSTVRHSVNTGLSVGDKQMGKEDGLKIASDGLIAELAVCKYFNVYPDLSFDPRSGGFDCIINGKKVDVKSTRYGKTNVYLPERKKHNQIDRYIWCWVDFRNVTLVGWFAPNEIFLDENLFQSPRPDEKHYCIDLKKAHQFKEKNG